MQNRLSRIIAATALSVTLIAGPPGNAAAHDVEPASSVKIQTVFVLMLENSNWSRIKGSASAPYINTVLLPAASRAEQYFNPPGVHPSEPNYIWLEGASNVYPDITFTTDNDPGPGNSTSSTDHLVSRLERAGVTWTSYQEDITGTGCPLTPTAGYFPRHNPMVYFQDVTENNRPDSAKCEKHVRPLSELAGNLKNGTVARYNFITPNICNIMHDVCPPVNDRVRQGDNFLAGYVPTILQSDAYKDNGALFIVFDEAESPSDGPIMLLALSPLAKGNGYASDYRYDHSSTVLTMQKIFDVLPPMRNAAGALDLSDLFLPGVFPAPAAVTLSGPPTAPVGVPAAFSAAVAPAGAGLPLTYTWTIGGRAPLVRSGKGATDQMSFSWSVTGTHTVTVSVQAPGGAVSSTANVQVSGRASYLPALPLRYRADW